MRVCAHTLVSVLVACLGLLVSLRSQTPNQIEKRREWVGAREERGAKKRQTGAQGSAYTAIMLVPGFCMIRSVCTCETPSSAKLVVLWLLDSIGDAIEEESSLETESEVDRQPDVRKGGE